MLIALDKTWFVSTVLNLVLTFDLMVSSLHHKSIEFLRTVRVAPTDQKSPSKF